MVPAKGLTILARVATIPVILLAVDQGGVGIPTAAVVVVVVAGCIPVHPEDVVVPGAVSASDQ